MGPKYLAISFVDIFHGISMCFGLMFVAQKANILQTAFAQWDTISDFRKFYVQRNNKP
jgi:hypothetical protein